MSTSKTLYWVLSPVQLSVQRWVFYLLPIKEQKHAGKFLNKAMTWQITLKGKFTDLVDGVKEKFSSLKG